MTKPSQRLVAPINQMTQPGGMNMFGHSISKGVDIDGNKYLDLAIGAPNAESVIITL